MQLGGAYTSADVTFDKVTVRIDGQSAEVKATATIVGARQGQNVKLEEIRIRTKLKKLDGEWRIERAIIGPASTHDAAGE